VLINWPSAELAVVQDGLDKGWISFDDDGRILRSPQLRDSVAGTLGLNDGIQIKNLHPQHREHLVRHRNDVFKAA